jgi:hypothetical protein
LLEALGETPEYGTRKARVILPESLYIAHIGVEEVGVTPEREGVVKDSSGEVFTNIRGEEVALGNSPYVQVTTTVHEGPLVGNGFSSRFYITPGKGRNIAFVNIKALAEFGITLPQGASTEDSQRAFAQNYLSLDPEQRLAFMCKWANVDQWDGKIVVVKVGQEAGEERINEFTGLPETPIFNRLQGFYAMTDTKRGAVTVRGSYHAQHLEAATAMGINVA